MPFKRADLAERLFASLQDRFIINVFKVAVCIRGNDGSIENIRRRKLFRVAYHNYLSRAEQRAKSLFRFHLRRFINNQNIEFQLPWLRKFCQGKR